MLAVLLANFVIFAPQKVEGQGTIPIDISENPDQDNRVWIDIYVGIFNFYGCRSTGGNCMADVVVTP